MNNKENQDEEPASDLQSAASPKISSTGASEDPAREARADPSFPEGQAYEMAPGHDHLHWGGVGHRHPAPSVSSSCPAERDDKSIYEGEEQHADEEEEEEEPEEITLTQVPSQLPGIQLRSESSNVESTYAGISGAGSLADVVDGIADQAVAGELSPRQAAAAIRSATRGAAAAAAAGGGAEEAGAAAITAAGDGLDARDGVILDGSVSGIAHSSVAHSEEGWQGGGGSGVVGGSAGFAGSLADMMESVQLGAVDELPAAAAAAPAEEPQAQPAAPAQAEKEQEEQEKGVAAEAQPPESSGIEGSVAEEAAAAAAAGAVEPEGGNSDGMAAAAAAAVVAAVGAAAAGGAVAPAAYQSRLMQQLTTEGEGEEDDLAVYIPDAAGLPQDALPQPPQLLAHPEAAAAVAAAARPAAAMEPLSIASGSGSGAAQAAAVAQQQQQQDNGGLPFPQGWYETFKGLLYMDGVDALGRPVVLLNADVVPSNMKSSALVYVKAHLEPLVNQGDYVLVLTSRGAAKLPSMWVMGAYSSLPRPFRKHVQYIVLVRPSAFLRAVLAFMRPFVSKKAGRKIRQVQSLEEIAAATEGEVTLQSLGPAFAAEQLAGQQGGAADLAP